MKYIFLEGIIIFKWLKCLIQYLFFYSFLLFHCRVLILGAPKALQGPLPPLCPPQIAAWAAGPQRRFGVVFFVSAQIEIQICLILLFFVILLAPIAPQPTADQGLPACLLSLVAAAYSFCFSSYIWIVCICIKLFSLASWLNKSVYTDPKPSPCTPGAPPMLPGRPPVGPGPQL